MVIVLISFRIKFNGEPLTYEKDDESFNLKFGRDKADRFELQIETALNPAQNTS